PSRHPKAPESPQRRRHSTRQLGVVSAFPFPSAVSLQSGVVSPESVLAGFDSLLWRGLRLLGEDIQNDNCISVDAVDEAPRRVFVLNPELVATATDIRHRTGVGEGNRFPCL